MVPRCFVVLRHDRKPAHVCVDSIVVGDHENVAPTHHHMRCHVAFVVVLGDVGRGSRLDSGCLDPIHSDCEHVGYDSSHRADGADCDASADHVGVVRFDDNCSNRKDDNSDG